MITAAQSLHIQRADDWLEAVEGWQSSHGTERAYWRGRVRIEIARERRVIAARTQWLRDAAPTITHKEAA